MDKSAKRQANEIPQVTLFMFTLAALLLMSAAAHSESQQTAPKVGEEYEITKKYQTSEQGTDGSSGSSRGREALLERVIGVRQGGLELEFDLPKSATAEDRARSWQFPVQVFRSSNGTIQLLNRPELEARIDDWLTAAGWTRADCGRWIFTWNAFRVECDPESVIKTVETFDLRSLDIGEGDSYQTAEARGPGTLARISAGPDGATYSVVMEIDPEVVSRARAESDVAVGQIMQKPVTLEAALVERSNEDVSGTVSVTFDTDLAGNIRSRTKVTKLETRGADNRSAVQIVTETTERRPSPRPDVPVR
jgi:hypothetical protein